jgi:hypothetical protein
MSQTHTVRPAVKARFPNLVALFAPLVALALSGCGSVNGPGIDYMSPRVVGRVVDDASGAPVANAQVGRSLFKWRKGGGEFLHGGEELLLRQEYVRSDHAGQFTLPGAKVALLFSFGEFGLNMRVTIQNGRYIDWVTNYPVTSLSTNSCRPEIDAGDIRIRPR